MRVHPNPFTALYPVESAPRRRLRVVGKPVITCRDRPLSYEPLRPLEQEEGDESHLWRALAIATPAFGLFYVLVGIAAWFMHARGLI